MWDEDLYQEGQIGLLKALDAYDPTRGTFVTIAWLKVHTEITRRLNSVRKVMKYEVPFEDLKIDSTDDQEGVTWEETFEGSDIDYNALVWHFTNWRDRRAAVCVFEQHSKLKRRKNLKEPLDKADARCERVFQEIMTLCNLWYGGEDMEYPTIEEFRAKKHY